LALDDADYRRDVGGFFKSLHGTLNHLLLTDRLWLRPLTGEGEVPATLDAIIQDDRRGLTLHRADEDDRLIGYIKALYEIKIQSTVKFGNSSGKAFEQPLSQILSHLFNHQAHHRGQAHTILSICTGREPPSLDLLLMQRGAPRQTFGLWLTPRKFAYPGPDLGPRMRVREPKVEKRSSPFCRATLSSNAIAELLAGADRIRMNPKRAFGRSAACHRVGSFLKSKGPAYAGPSPGYLFLLLALGVSLIAMLASCLRMLLCARSMLPTLVMIALAVMFGGGSVCLGRVFVVFGGFIVLVSRHLYLPWLVFNILPDTCSS
jgi:uncharacterized damage-inducible protein DinB